MLVVDGFEKLEGDARKRALELIAAVKDDDFNGWNLIITCQTQSWESVQDALIGVGITNAERLDFGKPPAQEIYDAIPHLPEIRILLMRSHLQPILRNLVMLDWVLRAGNCQAARQIPHRYGSEKPILSTGSGNGGSAPVQCVLQRDSLLRTLGRREGEKLSGAVHVDTIERDQLPLLGTFAQEGLIRENPPSVQFQHDLMGDWARFRALLFAENNAISEIKSVAQIPRWGRAIRLYAQALAEKGDGLAAWKAAGAQLSGEDADAVLANDIFLDGLLFAANSEVLLEQVWPHLIADGGAILSAASQAVAARSLRARRATAWTDRSEICGAVRGLVSHPASPFTGIRR